MFSWVKKEAFSPLMGLKDGRAVRDESCFVELKNQRLRPSWGRNPLLIEYTYQGMEIIT